MKKSLMSAFVMTAVFAFSGTTWADILIGVAGPITGPDAAFGAQLQKGAEQAAADINAAGGINGEQIKIVIGDDVSDPTQGVSVANKFVADGVKFVVGHFNSGVSIPASEVYAENGIMQIAPVPVDAKSWQSVLGANSAAFGHGTNQYDLSSYVAVQMIVEAGKSTGSTSPGSVAEALVQDGPFSTILGRVGPSIATASAEPRGTFYFLGTSASSQPSAAFSVPNFCRICGCCQELTIESHNKSK